MRKTLLQKHETGDTSNLLLRILFELFSKEDTVSKTSTSVQNAIGHLSQIKFNTKNSLIKENC